MPSNGVRRRVLVAAGASEEALLRALFTQAPLHGWDAIPAKSFEEARFVLQHSACDLLLVDEGLCQQQGADGLAWLASQRDVPVVFLARAAAEQITQAYVDGVNFWLPRDLALAHPSLMAAALERAAELTQLRRGQRAAGETVHQCRRQIDRLVGLLWRTIPMKPEQAWLTQRHMLERLQEEISRSERHGAPLTVALGEIRPVPALDDGRTAEPVLADWTTERITRAKRRCDVAGQYGLHGFMLLMVHTPSRGGFTCCRRLQQLLEAVPAVANDGPRGPVRAYFGVAGFAEEAASAKSLLHCAEQRLETARTVEEDRLVVT
jgi:diguanylate cyclase (GGDEF)-like protein